MSKAATAMVREAEVEVRTTIHSIEFTDEQIAQRAYEIFESEGSVHGNDQDHWFQAIQELTAESL